jgi:hypothetical protein
VKTLLDSDLRLQVLMRVHQGVTPVGMAMVMGDSAGAETPQFSTRENHVGHVREVDNQPNRQKGNPDESR